MQNPPKFADNLYLKDTGQFLNYWLIFIGARKPKAA